MRYRRGFALWGIFITLLAMALPMWPHGVSAQVDGRLNLTTSPLPINLITQPGTTVTAELRVKNSGSTTEELKVGLMKFEAFGTEGKPRLADREEGDEFFDWVSFSEDRITAEPNVWKTITMTIKVPEGGAFGYYYAVTFSRAAPADRNDDTAAVEGATAVLVLLEVDLPGAKRSLELTEFSTTKGVYEFLPTSFKTTLKNSGNIHVKPTGTIFISKDGKEIGQAQINPGGGNILPNSSRQFTGQWNDGFPHYIEKVEGDQVVTDKEGNTEYILDWNFNELQSLRFGKFTATILAVYDDGERDVPLEATVSFWVIPWRILAGAVLIAGLIITGIVFILLKILRANKRYFGKRRA